MKTPNKQNYEKDWFSHFNKRIQPDDGDFFKGKLGLDAGCGFGRHLHCVHHFGAEIVGLDLSEGVQRAFDDNRNNPKVHIVQGDIYHMPFRSNFFDFVYSFGVLHHLPNPQIGFKVIADKIRSGGNMKIWVYGLKGMSLIYRLSHLRLLRRITTKLPQKGQFIICTIMAGFLELTLWFPYRTLMGFKITRNIAKRFPAQNNAYQPFNLKITAVFDRLGTPITAFPTFDEINVWYQEAGFSNIYVFTPDRRGWQATGTKN